MWIKLGISAGILIAGLFFYIIALAITKRNRHISKIAKAKHFILMKKLLKIVTILAILIAIGFVWGINLENVWGIIISVGALVAIGFVAVWSLLSNILASVMIFFTSMFKIGDKIQILPEDIKGEVEDIGLVYTTIKTSSTSKEKIKIPNNIFFQKFVKIIK